MVYRNPWPSKICIHQEITNHHLIIVNDDICNTYLSPIESISQPKVLPASKDSVVLSQSKLSGHLSTELILRFLCTTLCFGIQGSQHSAYPLPYNSQNALIAIQSAIWAPRNTFQVSSKKQLPALTMSETDWSAKPGFIDLEDTGAFFLACVPALHTFIFGTNAMAVL